VVGSHFDNLIFGKLQIAIVYATMFFQNVTPFYHNIYILKAIPRFYKKGPIWTRFDSPKFDQNI
jgi:hypothetical protein